MRQFKDLFRGTANYRVTKEYIKYVLELLLSSFWAARYWIMSK